MSMAAPAPFFPLPRLPLRRRAHSFRRFAVRIAFSRSNSAASMSARLAASTGSEDEVGERDGINDEDDEVEVEVADVLETTEMSGMLKAKRAPAVSRRGRASPSDIRPGIQADKISFLGEEKCEEDWNFSESRYVWQKNKELHDDVFLFRGVMTSCSRTGQLFLTRSAKRPKNATCTTF